VFIIYCFRFLHYFKCTAKNNNISQFSANAKSKTLNLQRNTAQTDMYHQQLNHQPTEADGKHDYELFTLSIKLRTHK
jgi:hypothetical protein